MKDFYKRSGADAFPFYDAAAASSMLDLYKFFFKAVRWFGMIPIEYDEDRKTVRKCTRGLPYTFCRFNFVYITAYMVKQPIILLYNYVTHFKHDTISKGYMFQLLWCFGYTQMSLTFYNQVIRVGTISRTITMWLRLEDRIKDYFPADPPHKQMRRFKGLKMHLGIYGQNIVFSCFALPAIAMLLPNFPPFANSIILGKTYDLGPLSSWTCTRIRTYALSLVEGYTGFLIWACLASFDILICMVGRTIAHGIDKLQEKVAQSFERGDCPNVGVFSFYHALRIIVTDMNGSYGHVLFIHELFHMAVHVQCAYGMLNANESSLLTQFFISNVVGETARLFFLYQPMASVYTKSIKFKKLLKIKLLERNGQLLARSGYGFKSRRTSVLGGNDSRYLLKYHRALKTIEFRAWDFHRIAPSSFFDYMVAVFSYFVTVKNV